MTGLVPPVDPCGAPVDLLRNCYSSKMRFYADDCEKLLTVKWFFVERSDFIQNNVFTSSVWDDIHPTDGVPVGEQGEGHDFRLGDVIPAGAGIGPSPCGTPEQWAGQIALSDSTVPCLSCGLRSQSGSNFESTSAYQVIPAPIRNCNLLWMQGPENVPTIVAQFKDSQYSGSMQWGGKIVAPTIFNNTIGTIGGQEIYYWYYDIQALNVSIWYYTLAMSDGSQPPNFTTPGALDYNLVPFTATLLEGNNIVAEIDAAACNGGDADLNQGSGKAIVYIIGQPVDLLTWTITQTP